MGRGGEKKEGGAVQWCSEKSKGTRKVSEKRKSLAFGIVEHVHVLGVKQ